MQSCNRCYLLGQDKISIYPGKCTEKNIYFQHIISLCSENLSIRLQDKLFHASIHHLPFHALMGSDGNPRHTDRSNAWVWFWTPNLLKIHLKWLLTAFGMIFRILGIFLSMKPSRRELMIPFSLSEKIIKDSITTLTTLTCLPEICGLLLHFSFHNPGI